MTSKKRHDLLRRLVQARLTRSAPPFLLLLFACIAAEPPDGMPGSELATGKQLYAGNCVPCHGAAGSGGGSVASSLGVRARSFREEKFRFVSSEASENPSGDDVVRMIHRGSDVSHMPAHPQFDSSQLAALRDYVTEFRRLGLIVEVTDRLIENDIDFTDEEVVEIATDRVAPADPLAIPRRPAGFAVDRARAEALFAETCAPCHGPDGRGDGPQSVGMLDELERAIRPRNLTLGEYRGGAADRDLISRVRCGIPGTPMPAHGQAVVDDEAAWQLIGHLRRLAAGL